MSLEPSSEASPSLGQSIHAVLRGWRSVAQASTAPGPRVRAFLTVEPIGEWEFCWQGDAIHRMLPDGTSRPATAGEQEMLRKCMTQGWFFVCLVGQGQEPVMLHAVGIKVLDEPEPPLPSTLAEAEAQGDVLREETSENRDETPDVPEPGQGEPSPTRTVYLPGGSKEHAVSRGLVLLLLSGAVIGVIGWAVTHRSEIGLALAVLVLLMGSKRRPQAQPEQSQNRKGEE